MLSAAPRAAPRLGAGRDDLGPVHVAEAVAGLHQVAGGVQAHDLLADAARPPRLDLVPVPKHLRARPPTPQRERAARMAGLGAGRGRRKHRDDLAAGQAAAVVELPRGEDADEGALAAVNREPSVRAHGPAN